jgi:predicted dehydrogenase
MTSSRIPLLVVGTGFGCRIQVPALRAAGFDIVGLVGSDPARTAERAAYNNVPGHFTDIDEAITRTGAVAVTIATPPHTHASLALQAIARCCHVLCEKPFARNTSEARAMLDAVKRAGVAHVIGNEFRWLPERAMVARVIAEGRIGTPRFVTFTQYLEYLNSPHVEMPDWWWHVEEGGGWLGAWGSHLADWVRSWLGEFESLSATLPSVTAPDGKADDSFVVRFRLAGGAEGVLQQTAGSWGPQTSMVRVAGTEGTVWFENQSVWFADRSGTRELPIADDLLLPPPPPESSDPRQKARIDWQMMAQIELAPYVKLGEAWRTMIEGGTPSKAVAVPTFADGVASMEVLDAIRASAAQGGALVALRRSS